MLLRLLTIMAGPEFAHDAGSVVDFPEGTARALVAGGFAVAIGAPSEAPAPAPASEPDEPSVVAETAEVNQRRRARNRP
jgi:hypothetical protein